MALAVLLVLGLGGAVKLIHHEQAQNRQIQSLQAQQGELAARFKQYTEYYHFQPEYADDACNYLAIGNSLTLIDTWGRGICATQPDGDYVGLVKKHLEEQQGKVVAYRYNFATWERSSDRKGTLNLLDTLLSDKLNLVTIQLGENVTDQSTYEQDLEQLIAYVRERAPRAKIIVIGDFWDKHRNDQRREAAEHTGCPFADLAPIIGDKVYQSRQGTSCVLEDGSTVEVSEVAETHPGDKGFQYIAERVINGMN